MNTPLDPEQIQQVIDATREVQEMMAARLILVRAGVLSGDEVADAMSVAAEALASLHRVASLEKVTSRWTEHQADG